MILRDRIHRCLLKWLKSNRHSNRNRATTSFRNRPRLTSSELEDRLTPATFTVLNTNDSGADSLRGAIAAAVANPGDDVIDFNLGAGAKAISLSTFDGAGSALILGKESSADGISINGPTGAGNSLTVNWGGDPGLSRSLFNLSSASGTPVDGAVFVMKNFTITGGSTTTTKTGGAITMTGQNLTLSTMVLSANTANATNSGGGIFLSKGTAAAGILTINSGSVIGGAAAADGNVNLKSGSGATGNGGGIGSAVSGTPAVNVTINIANSTIGFNKAIGTAGGGICALAANITVTGSTIQGNTSGETFNSGGGGICVNSRGFINVDGSILTGNKSGAGGALGTGTGISNLPTITVSNSTLSNNTGTLQGGAIVNGNHISSVTTLNNCIVEGNVSGGLGGGGVYGQGGPVVVTNSTIQNNSTSGEGGGIRIVFGSNFATVTNSTIQNNTAGTFGGGMAAANSSPNQQKFTIDHSVIRNNVASGNAGGAIYFAPGTPSGGNLLLSNSTLSGNMTLGAAAADGGGGAIHFTGTVGTSGFTISNSTIAGNSSTSAGGAISLSTFVGTAKIYNSTIVNNTSAVSAGGIYQSGASGILELDSTVVAGNSVTSAALETDISAVSTVTANFSAVGVETGFTVSGGDNLIPANVGAMQLGPLADNGNGSTAGLILRQTISLGAASTLLDAGHNTLGLITDQRGAGTDAVNFPRTKGATDIGAVEIGVGKQIPSAASSAPSVTVSGTANPYQFTVTYTGTAANPINIATVTNKNGVITVTNSTAPAYLGTAHWVSDSGSSAAVVTAVYEIDVLPDNGSPNAWTDDDNGTYTINIAANKVFNTPAGLSVPAGALGTFDVSIPAFVVKNTNDSGAGSLRQAILSANAVAGADTITFSTGAGGTTNFNLPQTINLVSALPGLSDAVTITGMGSKLTTVSADKIAGNRRVFDTSSAPNGAAIAISGLTLTGGSTAGNGGGIVIGDEAVALTDMLISGNTAAGGGGIALSVAGGSLLLTNSTVTNNSSSTFGGGILNGAQLTVTSSTISNNNAATHGGGLEMSAAVFATITRSTISGNSSGGNGGGISLRYGQGALDVSYSTISGNIAGGSQGGGAVSVRYLNVGTFPFTISNSTIANNTASAASGGGLMLYRVTGELKIQNSTIVGNNAKLSGGGVITPVTLFPGAAEQGTFSISSTIISGNSAAGSADDLLSTVIAPAAVILNLTNSALGAPHSGFVPGAILDNLPDGANLKLAPVLALNGAPPGTPLTFLPAADSPLIDAGANPGSYPTDQRGGGVTSPPSPFPRQIGLTDIGAVEAGQNSSVPAVTGFTVNDGAAQRSRLTTITVTFAGTVTLAQFSNLGAITLTRTAATPTGTIGTIVQTGATGANGLITVSQPGPTNSITLVFSNADGSNETAGVEYGSLADGRWQLAISAASFTSTLGDPTLRRLFGDFETGPGSNGTVDGNDFANFGGSFGASGAPGFSPFDYDNNGTIDSVDLGAIGARFGFSV